MIQRRGGGGFGGEIKIAIWSDSRRELIQIDFVVAAGSGSAKACDPLSRGVLVICGRGCEVAVLMAKRKVNS